MISASATSTVTAHAPISSEPVASLANRNQSFGYSVFMDAGHY